MIDERGIKLIKDFESFSATKYLCPAKLLTIGWGHVIKPGESFAEPMSIDEANELLIDDIGEFEYLAERHIKAELTDSMYAAFISILFNVGPGGKTKDGILKLRDGRKSTLLRKLNSGDYEGAADAFLAWNKIAGVPSRGLARRREAERELFLEDGMPGEQARSYDEEPFPG
jgi:lysozyme